MRRALAATLVLLSLVGARQATADTRQREDTITIQPDGSLTWNLVPIKNDKELWQRLKRARAAKSEIQVIASPSVRYEAIMPVMDILRRCGCYKMGFIFTAPAEKTSTGMPDGNLIVTIQIEKNGSVFWNGALVKNDSELAEIARVYGKSGHRIRPDIVVRRGTPEATIDHVAGVLAQTDCCILGIVNTSVR